MTSLGRTRSGRPRVGVLQVVLSLTPGGTERLVIETSRRLASTYRIAVCCLDAEGLWADELRRDGIPVEALQRRPGFRPLLGRQVAAMAARHGASVLHCHHYSPFVYGCLARAFDPRLRVVFTEHGRFNSGPPSSKRRLANAMLSRLPHRVCVVSADLAGHMESEGFPRQQIEVVPNGIDPGLPADDRRRREARAKLGVDGDDAFVIGTVGRLDPVKDLGTLVAAYRTFGSGRPSARLFIVGDGPLAADLRTLAGGCPEIVFTGHRSDARELMPAFDAYVSSSIFEGMSLTILEAMAVGRPVVATSVGGTPEIVVNGETGLLVAPRDPAALAAALVDVAADRARAAAMGAAGRRRLCDRFTIDRMVDHYGTAYSQLGAL